MRRVEKDNRCIDGYRSEVFVYNLKGHFLGKTRHICTKMDRGGWGPLLYVYIPEPTALTSAETSSAV